MKFTSKLGLTIATGAIGAGVGGLAASRLLDPDVLETIGDLWPDFLAPSSSSAKDQGVAIIGGGVMLVFILIPSGVIWSSGKTE